MAGSKDYGTAATKEKRKIELMVVKKVVLKVWSLVVVKAWSSVVS